MGGKVRLPIAHDLRCDATLQRQAVASYNFLFRKEMLPCEHVKWRKRKRSGRAHLVVVVMGIGGIGGRRPLDALVVLDQARMSVLEVDVELALGEADVKVKVLLKGMFELG